jgi:hypothetical protein
MLSLLASTSMICWTFMPTETMVGPVGLGRSEEVCAGVTAGTGGEAVISAARPYGTSMQRAPCTRG